MPFLSLKTNQNISEEGKIALKKEFGKLISILPGKSESWLMVQISDKKDMFFKGSSEPCVMIHLDIYGGANSASLEEFTSKATSYVSKVLKIDPSRIYLSYFETSKWGYNGSNF